MYKQYLDLKKVHTVCCEIMSSSNSNGTTSVISGNGGGMAISSSSSSTSTNSEQLELGLFLNGIAEKARADRKKTRFNRGLQSIFNKKTNNPLLLNCKILKYIILSNN